MMKKITSLLLLCAMLIVHSLQTNAQCGSGATITTTESRCEATGTLSVSGATGTGPFQYDFTSYPANYAYTGPTSSSTITALNPGTYTLRVIDQGAACYTDYTVTVAGTYQQPTYYPTVVNVSGCTNAANGEIHGTMNDGRAAFLYQIMPGSASMVGTSNATGDFTGLIAGDYNLRAYDSCGNFISETRTISNYNFSVANPVVTKTACGQYSFSALDVFPAVPTGAIYKVKDANGNVIASGTSFPIAFSNSDATISGTSVCVSDACGNDQCMSFSVSDWSITDAITDYTACNTFTTQSVTISGNPVGPLTYGFVRGTGDTVWSATPPPFTFGPQTTPEYFWGKAVVKDGCGVIKGIDNYNRFMELNYGFIGTSNVSCTSSSISISPAWNYVLPESYSINFGTPQSSGNFNNLPDGTYTITMTDACGNTTIFSQTVGHNWQLQGQSYKSCEVGYVMNELSINRRMTPPVVYQQYNADFSSLLSTQTYTNTASMSNPSAGEWDWWNEGGFSMYYPNSLPNTTYNYIATDACGYKDTVTLVNGDAHIGNSLTYTVTPVCTNLGNVIINYASDNESWDSVMYSFKKVSSIGYNTAFTSNLTNTFSYSNLDTGTYVATIQNKYCPTITVDTIIVPKFVEPKLRKSIAFNCAGGSINVVGSAKYGMKPYQYEIFQTIPAGGEQPLQSSNIFTLTGTYTLIRMRVQDACGHTSTQDMAVRPPAVPAIKVTQKLPVCNLSQLNLYVDSIYAGATYEWKNPAGTVIGTSASINLPVSTADTGTYSCRVIIAGTCYDNISTFNLRAKEFGCYAQLGNYVWNDVNHNGTQDNGEVGVAGVTVTLYDANNVVVGATVTDAYGYYLFKELNPGDYHVGFTLPSNYVFTTQNTGSNDLIDSDVNPTSGLTSTVTLAVSDSNMSVDAGIYLPATTTASLGDYVWNDTNHDGIQDPTETGVAGVTVTLYDNSGNPIATTVTDGTGHYSFNNLTPGTYSVGFSLPVGYVYSPANQGTNTGLNSDANITTGKTSSVTLVAGDNNTTLDAGIYAQDPIKASLGNYVWNDVNNNGIQDPNETGVAGVTVTLYAANGTTVIATTTTDEFGYYIFNNLNAGDYVVGFSNLPAGFSLVSPNTTDDNLDSDPNQSTGKTAVITLSAGEKDMTVDAGIYNATLPTGALGNYVWLDANQNGIQDATETGVAGVTVTLYDAATNAILATTTTDASGHYMFNNLDAGNYVVGFSTLPEGYKLATSTQGTDGTIDSNPNQATGLTNTIVLAQGEVNLTIDAGIVNAGGRDNISSLGDIVWNDANQNGIQDPGELGVAGVTVTLYAADGTTVIETTQTDALGNYIFTNLPGGNYVVGFSNLPAGYTFSSANQGTDSTVDGNADAASGGKSSVINLGIGEDNLTIDAGIYPAPNLASLGNYVWNDLNNDGVQDAGEPGVPGVTVTLYNTSGVALATTTTDANGLYQFTGLTPGSYYVEFTNLPAGYSFTDKDAGANTLDNLDSDADPITGATPWVTLVAGQNYPDLDAGIVTEKASLGNYVWNDLNNDGIQDPNEVGIAGITVTLYAADGVTPIAFAVTNAAGYYSFVNLEPGTYVVGFSGLPQGATFSPATQGGNTSLDSNPDVTTGKSAPVTLAAGDYNPTIDAGIHLPSTAGLGNYVWFDANNNGVQDATEVGVPGVTVTLYDVNGVAIKTAITDQNGAYSFTNLEPGTYSVGFSSLPTGFGFTSSKVGSNTTDNDVTNITFGTNGYPTFGTTNQVTIVAGEYNPNIDAGLRPVYALGTTSLVANATLRGDVTTVSWITVEEKNVRNFDIERSIDGNNFISIAQKTAKGNTTGSTSYFINDNISNLTNYETIYYRVKSIDQDYKIGYSNIVNVHLSSNTDAIKIYPVPFIDKIVIDYPSNDESELTAIVTDMTGKIILSKSISVLKGNNTFTIDGLDNLAKGSYFISIKDENKGELFVKKISKL